MKKFEILVINYHKVLHLIIDFQMDLRVKRLRKCSFRLLFTVRNEVAKVMFLHLSVCPQEG